MACLDVIDGLEQSRPVWGAWIEMTLRSLVTARRNVAPRMGRVD